jgi:hypothetical protein
MLPRGYRSLVVCDTRRAEEWKAGLARAGFDVALAETAPDNVKGACEVGVIEEQELAAKAFVTDVVKGRAKLPRPPTLSPTGFKALMAVAVLLAALAATLWLAHLW